MKATNTKALFDGSQRVVINETGRLALPARFRKPFLKGDAVLVLPQDEPCLRLYPTFVWQFDKGSTVVTESELIRLDQQNRLTIPAKWRQLPTFPLCEIDNTVFVGAGDRLELWSEGDWFKN